MKAENRPDVLKKISKGQDPSDFLHEAIIKSWKYYNDKNGRRDNLNGLYNKPLIYRFHRGNVIMYGKLNCTVNKRNF